jgi:hypothetical protein
LSEGVVLDAMPMTSNRANTFVSGASWKIFQRRYPEKTFEEFCCQYQSLHSYPLHYFMTMNDNSKFTLVELSTCEAPVVKEEPHGGQYTDGSCIDLPFFVRITHLD